MPEEKKATERRFLIPNWKGVPVSVPESKIAEFELQQERLRQNPPEEKPVAVDSGKYREQRIAALKAAGILPPDYVSPSENKQHYEKASIQSDEKNRGPDWKILLDEWSKKTNPPEKETQQYTRFIRCGILNSTHEKVHKEVSLGTWGADTRLDIRKWENGKPGKGISLTADEVKELRKILDSIDFGR